ncbi:hypothetical protein RhiirA4_453757 [Rhizophagus irregularis]|uniref:Uncharacterized protein n=1 Tax=Rhizophagus irregularis TaxID=588596 RepID=A0A2I1G183_9GLOM|nr:hypothetical protein RhiirA4_453757 [Rhizophagus irregularis]
MDAGIIMAFKKHYQCYYIRWIWDEISADTIQNCWNHTEILPNTFPLDDIYKDDIDNELDIVYLIPEDQIISEIARLFKSESDADHPDEVDDSTEVETICINEALKSLKTVHTFLIQQENANSYMKLMDKIEKFIKREQINSMQQTIIDKYFR